METIKKTPLTMFFVLLVIAWMGFENGHDGFANWIYNNLTMVRIGGVVFITVAARVAYLEYIISEMNNNNKK